MQQKNWRKRFLNRKKFCTHGIASAFTVPEGIARKPFFGAKTAGSQFFCCKYKTRSLPYYSKQGISTGSMTVQTDLVAVHIKYLVEQTKARQGLEGRGTRCQRQWSREAEPRKAPGKKKRRKKKVRICKARLPLHPQNSPKKP